MDDLLACALAAFAVALLAVVYVALRPGADSDLPLPPGPPGNWLFGNSIPSEYPYRKFEELTKEYGPVFSLRQGSKILVVVGRHQAALDIMEKEGAALVDRPRSISAGEVLSGGMRVLLTRHGDRFRKMRRALHSHLQVKAVESYEPVQFRAAKTLALDILNDPVHHQDHAKRFAASMIMTLAYGKTTPTSYSDPEVQQVNKCLTTLGKMVKPGAYLVDTYPILQYIPGYLSQVRKWHQEELSLFRGQLDRVREKMANDHVQPCFAKYVIERQSEYDLTDDESAYLAGSMFGAGSDTTASAISILVLAAACFPQAQAKVQEELDLVVGKDRVPSFGDQNSLPQVTAFMLETYRWRPVSAGGFAHRAMKDIIWKNYKIPEGASVIGNHWSIGRDPDVYPNPEHFDPQRWLNEDGCVRQDLKFPNWGFGRRVCPGQHVANRSVFINAAMLLWAFTITPDPAAPPIDTLAFTQSANTHPLPFSVRFIPRIARLQEMLSAETDE